MTTKQLFSMWPAKIGRAIRRYYIRREIRTTQRHLELTQREIANSLEVKRHLTQDLMCLKRELNSI